MGAEQASYFISHREAEVRLPEVIRDATAQAISEALTQAWGSTGSAKSSALVWLASHGSHDLRSQDPPSIVVSSGQSISTSDLASWYANQKLSELRYPWAFSPSSVVLNTRWAAKPAEPAVQPWTEISASGRWLERSGLVATGWLDTGWSDAQAVPHGLLWPIIGRAEHRHDLGLIGEIGLFAWLPSLNLIEDFRRQADAFVDRLARYVRRKLVRRTSRVRHVRLRALRPAVAPLTMSVTVHAPPHPSCIEGRRVLRGSPLAA